MFLFLLQVTGCRLGNERRGEKRSSFQPQMVLQSLTVCIGSVCDGVCVCVTVCVCVCVCVCVTDLTPESEGELRDGSERYVQKHFESKLISVL